MTEEQRIKAVERAKAWIKANPDRFKANYLRSITKRKEQIARDAKARYAANPAKYNSYVYKLWATKPWYRSWVGAKQRCTNPNDSSYRWYGAKGITFNLSKDETRMLWERDKASEMDKPTIDRIDSSKGYYVENCRFLEKMANSLDGLGRAWRTNQLKASKRIADITSAGKIVIYS